MVIYLAAYMYNSRDTRRADASERMPERLNRARLYRDFMVADDAIKMFTDACLPSDV